LEHRYDNRDYADNALLLVREWPGDTFIGRLICSGFPRLVQYPIGAGAA